MLKLLRKKPEPHVEVVADLDALLSEPIGIKILGVVHVIKPIDTATFLKTMNAFAVLLDEKGRQDRGEKIPYEQLVTGYAKLFGAVCDTIGEKEVRQMNNAQIGALLQNIIDHVTGRLAEKKKMMPTQTLTGPTSA